MEFVVVVQEYCLQCTKRLNQSLISTHHRYHPYCKPKTSTPSIPSNQSAVSSSLDQPVPAIIIESSCSFSSSSLPSRSHLSANVSTLCSAMLISPLIHHDLDSLSSYV